jgi:endoglucanase
LLLLLLLLLLTALLAQHHSQNSDVFLGYIGWAAGSFDPTTYELSEVPTKNGNTWTDSALVQACLKRT